MVAYPERSADIRADVPPVARIAALAVIALLFGLWLAGVPIFIRGIIADLDTVLKAIFVADAWTPSAVRAAADGLGMSPRTPAWLWLGIEVAVVASFGAGGLVLFWRKMDWFGTYLGVAFVLIGTNIAGPVIGMLSGVVPWLSPFVGYDGLVAVMAVLSFVSLLYVFPTGQFVPAWTRWFAPAGVIIISLYDSALGAESFTSGVDVALNISYLAVGLGSQIYRYWRVSDAVQRQQSKWVILSFALFLLTLVGGWMVFPNALSNAMPPTPRDLMGFMVTLIVLSASTMLLFVALAIAILRYRLWDIDVIIRRTLVYGLLSAALAAVYFGAVTLLQAGFVSLIGQASPLAIVVSTLIIAALFIPLRRRVQFFIDRRFYRSKYDAQRTLEAFSDTLRDAVDLDRMTLELVNVVDKTVQPEHVALWIARHRADDFE